MGRRDEKPSLLARKEGAKAETRKRAYTPPRLECHGNLLASLQGGFGSPPGTPGSPLPAPGYRD